MNIRIELTEEDIKKLSTEMKLETKVELTYKKEKIDDLDLFMKIVKDERKSI